MTSAPWRVETWKNSKKNRKQFEISKVSKKVPKSVQTCFEVISLKFFVHCTLEGREVEKFQKNGKTSEFSNWPKTFSNVSILVLRGFFSNFIYQCTLEIKNSNKNWKKLNSWKCPKTFLKVSKQVPNLFWGIFREKIFAQCTLEGRNLEKSQKNGKTFIFLQRAQISSQKGSNAFWTCFEVVFSVKKLTSAPWRVETWKNSKKSTKIWNFKSVQKRSWNGPNKFWNCFEVIFSEKIALCTLEGPNWEKLQKTGKLSIFKMPKYVPKSVQACFEHASRYFFR